ncbi:MAG: anaerobic ribonucleoside-triphosphate reductase activating protein [Planctomycetota bacterium]|jgi:pyruvate formate lyase activating enzyme|nr:anaerobic ribonucleoside-triphosphate reductase activating protein [Planctomycetota bacterium]
MMNFRGFLPSSFNEWEGRVAAVVFTGGCNWRCAYCHGARLVADFATLPAIAPEKIAATLRQKRDWLDGIVITGGEPTLQPDLIEFIRELHALPLPVKLSTNGSQPAVVARLLTEKLPACLSFDYKAPSERLARLAGITAAEVAAVRESYDLARQAAPETVAEIEFHTTLCPRYVNREILATMARELACPRALWILQQYENDIEMLDAKTAGTDRYPREELDALAAVARREHANVLLRYGK